MLHRAVFDTLCAVYVSNLSSAEFLSSHKIFSLFHCFPRISYSTKGSFPVYLRDSFSRQYTAILFQFICNTLLIFSANAALMETIILLPRLPVSGFSQKYVHKWAWQNKHFRLDSLINSVDYLVFCLSAQGTYSQRSGGAPEGTSWGRHLHAWGHPEGERGFCMSDSKLASASSLLCLQNKHHMVQRAKWLLC